VKRAAKRPSKRRTQPRQAAKRNRPTTRSAKPRRALKKPARIASPHTFVLVHGAWHGGWCWRRVADLLIARGHRVFTPTLTGLGERSHLMSRDINLDTHISDVVNVIKWENLKDVVLVGHSYAGWVISGVAERAELQIASIVYLDAMMPADGQQGIDLQPEQMRAEILSAAEKGAISRFGPDAKRFGVNEKDLEWVNAKLTPQPIGVSLQPIKLTGARERIARKTYIRAKSYEQPAFDRAYAEKKADPAWRVLDVPCGHDVMIDMPDGLVKILLQVA
jgi:pimeloyl-ACP methyl ester carboxylesterase